MLLGCIGDDFTGSSDLANTLAKGGMRVVQYCGTPSGPAEGDVEAGVVALKSRTRPAREAVAESLAALEWLRGQGCRQFLFKYCSTFDSTPDGNIGPVAAALAEALDARRVVVCPAFPATGRTVYQGHLFVGDRLLSETGMREHPLTPMTDPDIRRWLARQTDMPVGHVGLPSVRRGAADIARALDAEDARGRRLIVVDAVEDEDLRAIGAAVEAAPLVTGGSGVALGLPENFRRAGLLKGAAAEWRGAEGRCVILAGSCSEATRRQIAVHAASNPTLRIDVDAVIEGRVTGEGVARWLLSQDGLPLAYSSDAPSEVRAAQERHGAAEAAAAVEDLFRDVARRVRAAGVARIVVAGGETSGAVVEALEAKALEIGPEIAPGVPALRTDGLALALKSGNFGDDAFFARAAEVLAGAR